ncbi:MAG: helix-turn-helix transcriptional regulator [Bacilli bacterium]|nr:helix-turn-helix transcriptional regulator [Bacilli bacterium]
MNAYSDLYISDAQDWLGEFFETSIYVLNVDLKEVWKRFILSQYSLSFGSGDPFTILGKSGSEVAFELCGKRIDSLPFIYDRPPEYWLGWALAYYQWYKNIPFHFITNHIDVETILLMYKKYHEIDIMHFCNEMDRLIKTHRKETNLKRLRKNRGLSQKELADITSIPVRTIQQYEQRQKNINKAQANYIFLLAQALSCSPKDLLEY